MKIRFTVTGMTCAACSARVEKVAGHVIGVNKAEVNLFKGSLVIDAENDGVIQPVLQAISEAGYGASAEGRVSAKKENIPNNAIAEMKKRVVSSFAFLLVLMYFTMGHMLNLPLPDWYHGRIPW